jgi:hypothetical protein
MSLQNKRIVFTGFRDDHLKQSIQDKGGKVVSAVSGLTNILVTSGDITNAASSKKTEDARLVGAEIIEKEKFVGKYIIKQGWFAKLFGTTKSEPKSKEPRKIEPKVDGATSMSSGQTKKYLIHDNGGRPFQVNITHDQFTVYRQSKVAESGKGYIFYEGDYDKVLVKPTKYLKLYVGKDPNYGKKFDGNTILAQVSAKKYMYIGEEIFTFTITDDITGYKSPIQGSDVAYAYARGTKNTYLMIEKTFIPNDELRTVDPYDQLYGMDTQHGNKHKREHKLNMSLVQKRI